MSDAASAPAAPWETVRPPRLRRLLAAATSGGLRVDVLDDQSPLARYTILVSIGAQRALSFKPYGSTLGIAYVDEHGTRHQVAGHAARHLVEEALGRRIPWGTDDPSR